MSLSAEERSTLIRLAREAVAHAVARGPVPQVGTPTGALAEKRGCFVTLTNHDHLRGCIGTFSPRVPLAESVVEMAEEGCHDPRFIYNPITARELPQLTIEVSVLSPLRLIDNPLALEIGTHGIYVVRGYAAGCFLPEVATDMGWNAEEFLTHCCEGKAGMAGDAWRQPGTQVFVFTSEKFAE